MGASEYYLPTGVPSTGSDGDSATIRNEFSAIKEGISEKLPDLAGNNNEIVGVNGGATGLEVKEASAVKIQLSLENVDNTSDADKPVSDAQNLINDSKEDSLGNPSEDGFILSGDTSGGRAWVQAVPVGTILTTLNDTPLDGTLELNGSAISRTVYSDLYAHYGIKYGAGDGSTTFNIPDARGVFFRNYDNGAGVDPDAAARTDRGDGTGGDVVGSKQAEDFLSHTHDGYLTSHDGAAATGVGPEDKPASNFSYHHTTTRTVGAAGGNETRPSNINVLRCVKY